MLGIKDDLHPLHSHGFWGDVVTYVGLTDIDKGEAVKIEEAGRWLVPFSSYAEHVLILTNELEIILNPISNATSPSWAVMGLSPVEVDTIVFPYIYLN